MSIADFGALGAGSLSPLPKAEVPLLPKAEALPPSKAEALSPPKAGPPRSAPAEAAARPLHRLQAVRKQQNVSLRNMARRMHVDLETVRRQEEPTCDLTLTQLHAWQQVLEVPIAEMLVDSDAPLSAPVMERARLVKLMKTAVAILEKAETPSMRRMVQTLLEQLTEIMPELKDVGPWHAVGQRRSTDEIGRVAERRIADDFYRYDT